MTMYQPKQTILERYARVLVRFALGKGRGIAKGDVVYVTAYESAKPLYAEVLKAVTKAGGHVLTHYMPDSDKRFNVERDFFLSAKDHQLRFSPTRHFRGLVDEIDHSIFIEGMADMESLKGVDPKKIMANNQSRKLLRKWRAEKESQGRFTWTIGLYGTRAMAREAGLTEKAYWSQIIKACFLDKADPVAEWRRVEREIGRVRDRLNAMPIDTVRVVGPDADLRIAIGEKRMWRSGGGANIPSFEIFTSPDWRGTDGWIRFNEPLYGEGHLVKGITLFFRNGRVAKAAASKGEKFLHSLVATPNGDKIGEFSLTDKRFSKITKFMATTLYDENMGGPNGNTHIALGSSYHSCYAGDPAKVSEREWAKFGFNDSAIHRDIISTAPRTVTARLRNGKEKVIYANGSFAV